MNDTINRAFILAILATLSGCNGGNSADDTRQNFGQNSDRSSVQNPDAIFSGTVSTTKRLAEPEVSLKTPDGVKHTADLNESGQFVFNDAAAGDRYLSRVDLGNGNYLYAIAHLNADTNNRQNIHSYSDLAARTWFADQGEDIDWVFGNNLSIENFPDDDAFEIIETNIQSIVSDVLQVYGLEDINLSDAYYEATDTGIDRFLNENPVIIRFNHATIIVHDPQTSMQSVAADTVPLQTTFGVTDITPPQQPQGLRANGTADNEIVLAWTITTDNIGIASYEIYRDDTFIDSTPFPVYRDSELDPQTNYEYTVVARDESGNRSVASVAAITSVLDSPDTEAPSIPSQATLEADAEQVKVFWLHDNLSDLSRFEVKRTSEDGILLREVTSERINDITVTSGIEYCYEIVAIDATGNRSEPNPVACITTSGASLDTTEDNAIPATISMAQDSITGTEGTTISAFVRRTGEPAGEVSIDYIVTAGSASADEDYIADGGTLVWADGDAVAKRIFIELLADGITEENETLSIVLTNSSSNSVVTNTSTLVTIVDN